jgi:hypothetical protein
MRKRVAKSELLSEVTRLLPVTQPDQNLVRKYVCVFQNRKKTDKLNGMRTNLDCSETYLKRNKLGEISVKIYCFGGLTVP